MSLLHRAPLALLIGCGALVTAAHADDRFNARPWDYKVHGSATGPTRATLMWQAERTGASGWAGSASGSGGALGGMPSVGSVANMNVVTVVVGDRSTVDVAVEADQRNTGAIKATAVTATGATVNLGGLPTAAASPQQSGGQQ